MGRFETADTPAIPYSDKHPERRALALKAIRDEAGNFIGWNTDIQDKPPEPKLRPQYGTRTVNRGFAAFKEHK